jgi:O-antigen/teichoic acid export membrane protein
LVQLVVQVGFILYLVRWAGLGLSGVLTGNLAGLLTVNLAAILLLAREASWRVDLRLLAAMASYGLAMIPVFLSGWIVDLSDRFFVQALAGPAVLGVYSLGYKFGALVNVLLVMPFQQAWTPLFFATADDPSAPKRLARATTYLFAATTLCSLATGLSVRPFLRLTAAPEFRGAAGVVPLICLAYLIAGVASCLGNGLVVSKRVGLLSAYAVAAAAANLVLNGLLIPRLGMYGAALATVLAFSIQLVGILRSLARHYPVGLEWSRLGWLAIAGWAPLLASCALPSLPLGADLGVRAGLFAVFPAVVLLARLPRPEELAAIRERLVAFGVIRPPEGVRANEDPVAGGGEGR